MKLLRPLFACIMIVSLFSCKSDDDNNQFILTYENLAGLYDLVLLNGTIETTVDVEGIPVTAVTTIVGDTFQIETTFNQNGTYHIEGEYRVTVTVTVAGTTETNTEIIVLNENGTYQIDTNAQTVTISGFGDLLDGTFEVTLFNENEIRLFQEKSTIEDGVVTDSVFELRFTRQ